MANVQHSTLDADHAWALAEYSSSIKFSKATRYMPQQTVSGAIAFTVDAAGALAGGGTLVRLVADGTNAPTFTGMTESGSSMGYDNRYGIVNAISFWFDGTTYWYAVLQAANAVSVLPPRFVSAVASDATKTVITLTYNVPLDTNAVPATSAFTLGNTGGADTVTSVAIRGSMVILTKSRTTVNTDAITVTYAVPGSNPVRDLAGNNVAALSAQAVTNNVGTTSTSVTLATLNNITLSSGVYTSTGVGGWTTSTGGNGNASIPASTNGYLSCRAVDITRPFMLTLDDAQAQSAFTTHVYGIYRDGVDGRYKLIVNGAVITTTNVVANVSAIANDVVRLRRSGTTTFAEVSTDGGSNWTTIDSRTGMSTAQLWPQLAFDTGTSGRVDNLQVTSP